MESSDQKRAIVAVVLSGIILFGWQYFFAPPTPVQTPEEVSKTEVLKKQNSIVLNQQEKVEEKLVVQDKNSFFQLENEKNFFVIDSYLTVTNAIYKPSKKSYIDLFDTPNNNKLLFLQGDLYKPIYFQIEQINATKLKMKSDVLSLSGIIELNDKGFLDVQLNSPNIISSRYTLVGTPKNVRAGNSRQFAYYTDELNLEGMTNEERGDANIKWAGIDFDYHIFTYVFDDDQNFSYQFSPNGHFSVTSAKPANSLHYSFFFARKEYDDLTKAGHKLHLAVDFGIWSLIAVPILRGLQLFYSWIPNYGVSIILLTFLIRLLLSPLQYKSFKSMKKMQDVQPELTKLKEKFKDEPQRLQAETMALFKKAGANPLGGCLPLLLQMPVFFAFYKVLYSAVELVGAPFMLWIHDLSEKDPYYVLPVLMAVTMFIQQKITPSASADPTQRKIMLFMPLIFGVFMKDLPAGLNLYIFISTLAGISQQMFVYKRSN